MPMSVGQICGRDYMVVEPNTKHHRNAKKAKARYHVVGLHKADGTHIRFKSLAKAEAHIRNMKLVRG